LTEDWVGRLAVCDNSTKTDTYDDIDDAERGREIGRRKERLYTQKPKAADSRRRASNLTTA
jgi:hypothetical protein